MLRIAAGSLPTRVGGWLLEATRQLDREDQVRAGQALTRALRLAARERLRRPFREASPQVRQLLRGGPATGRREQRLGAATPVDGSLIFRFDGPVNRTAATSPCRVPILQPLTEKEREVLGHLAALLTTDEIAGAMFVSVNTVRTHLRSVLRKLASSRRNEAVRRAIPRLSDDGALQRL